MAQSTSHVPVRPDSIISSPIYLCAPEVSCLLYFVRIAFHTLIAPFSLPRYPDLPHLWSIVQFDIQHHHGPPLPTSVIPSGALPILSLTDESTNDERYFDAPPDSSTKTHADRATSESTKSFPDCVAQRGTHPTTVQSDEPIKQPHPAVSTFPGRPTYGGRRDGGLDASSVISPTPPPVLSFRCLSSFSRSTAAAEGLGDPPVARTLSEQLNARAVVRWPRSAQFKIS